MPKRSSETAEESPRKLVRTSSSTKSPVANLKKDDAALTAISDDEDNIGDDAGPVVKKVPPSIDLFGIQNRFFEQFNVDLQSCSSTTVDVDVYKTLLRDFPDDEESEKKALVDHFAREYLIIHILKDNSKWNSLIELSVQLSRAEVCSPSLPVTLMSDLFELSGLSDCELFFEYVENNLSVWKEPFFLNSGRNAILRMCNDLLRRLSRAQNTRFCGKILIFLASYFPFSERSGLNIISEFNTENVTVYKSGDGSDDPEDKMNRNEEGHAEENTKLFEGIEINIPGLDKILASNNEIGKGNKVKVDYNLYVKFWSLQDFFRNPQNCYNKVAWKTFSTYTQDVLGAFTSFKIEEPRSKIKTDVKKTKGSSTGPVEGQKMRSSVNVIPKLGDEDLFFPKYLTNRRLLELQLGDPDFRRYFLVQLLIILQYLTASVKFKSESQVLSEEQLEFVKKTNERIYSLLSEMKPGGPQMANAVKHILKREDLWSKWKNDGCQPFKKPVTVAANITAEPGKEKDTNLDNDNAGDETGSTVKTIPKKRYLGDIIEEADANHKFLLGNSELTRLWNICGDNLEACRSKARDFAPSIEEFFAEAMKELDLETTPAPAATDASKREVKPKKLLGNSNFGWRSLRLLARKSPYFFQMISGSPIHPLQNYLEFILKKIVTEMELPVITEETATKPSLEANGKKPGKAVPASNTLASAPATDNGGESLTQQMGESEPVVEGGADENDELLKGVKDDNAMEDNEEGEVDKNVRNLTEDEQSALGKALGAEWKKLAAKLGFTSDEVEYFEAEKKTSAGEYMLKVWTEQEKDDATVADLLYQLEGLKLRNLANTVFP